MKKILFGLLIIAVAAGAYYFLQNQKTSTHNSIQKQLLTGQWKLDTIDHLQEKEDSSDSIMRSFANAIDSVMLLYHYDVRKDGRIVLTGDSLDTDTSYYEWSKTNTLLLSDKPADTLAEKFEVLRLTQDSLILRSPYSSDLVFTKMK